MSEKKQGAWPDVCVQRAFVEGAQWWEFASRGATMWGADRNKAEAEAVRRYGEPHDAAELQALAENLMAMACDTSNTLTVFDRKAAGDAAAQISVTADRLAERASTGQRRKEQA